MYKNDVDFFDEQKYESFIELKNPDFELEDFLSDEKKVEEEKKLLIYKPRSVSIFKIIYHLSGNLEIFLMIIGTLSTIFSGSANSLWGLIIGDTINELTIIIGLEDLPEKEYVEEIDKIESPVNRLIFYFILLGIFTFICNFFMLFMWGLSALRQMHNLKIKYFELILRQDQNWFDENNAFEFSTKIQTQFEQIEYGLGDRFGQIILMVSEIISGFTVGFMTSWKLTLIICASFPIIIISVLISDYFAEKLVFQTKKLSEKAGGIAEELLYNIKTVTSFCNFDFELNRYNELIDEVSKLEQKKILIESIAYGLLYLASFASLGLCILHSRTLIINQEINYSNGKPYNGGDVVTVVMCVLNVIYSLSGLGPNIQIIQKSCIASSDYFILLSNNKTKAELNKGYTINREDFKGKIEFKNVRFIYPHDKNQKVILDDLNFVIEPGKKIAIVGESGCGKSTAINLIERFYDVKYGQILIDDIDIKNYNLNNLRDLIGYVQQEPVLFNTSIRDNIIFGRERKLMKYGDIETMIKEACEEADIIKFIERNKDKYDYIVGIKGGKLSGGQKQRIAIARALLLKPKILILDEATSSLDNKSEKAVQKALDNICKKEITMVVIAHRLSTIKNSDIIYAMKDGKIIEKGTHKELLEMNGYYAGLIKEQLAAEEIQLLNEQRNNDINYLNTSMSLIVDTFVDESNIEENESVLTSENNLINNEKERKIKIDKKKLWILISEYRCSLIIGAIAGIIYGSISPFVGLILGMTVNSLSSSDPEIVKSEGFKFSMYYLGISVIGGLTIFLKMWKLQYLGSIISLKIKKKIIKKYLELHMGYFDIDKNSPGALSTKLAIDSSHLDSLILNLVGGIITSISTLVISFMLGVIYDWKITLILFLFVPFILYGIIKKDDYKENGRESNKAMKIEAGSFLSECVVNMKTIFSFNFQNKAIKLYEELLANEKKYYLKNSIKQAFWMSLGLSAYNFAFGAVYKCGFIFLRKKTVTFQSLMCCITIIINSCDGLSDILRNIGDTNKAKSSYKSIFDTLNTKVEISPFESSNKLKISPNNIKGNIEFKNVNFSYPTKPEQLILKDLSFTIKQGENVGIVGLSGSGKSTLLQLIERFYDVNSGEILIDGINIKDYNLFELRKRIGMVGQEPSIFKRNVYENILYGNLQASKDKVLEMAQRNQIRYLIDKNRYEQIDNPLSGGEKQRVAIARAFLKDPAIILLDEATSAMDKETENEIQKNIIELQKNKTCINISHRWSTINNSDIIFVLDSGQIAEKGTHEDLIKLKGKYYTLYKYSRK